jgi:GDP-L-fucose synthase
MKVLVTGATGFLGRHLTKKLREKGWEIFISNSHTANLSKLENLYIYNDVKFDFIFHLAIVTKAGDYALTHQGDQWLNNQILNTNILQYWKDHQPQAKMVTMGTSCSYSPGIDMKEDNYLLGEPDDGLYTYAMTKRMLLIGLQSIQKQYGLKWLYFIPSTLYGPNFELHDNHFIFDFIRNFYNAKYHNMPVNIWGDGMQRRELIHVEDAADIIIKLLSQENEMYNLGSGEDNSINEFAQHVADAYNFDFNKAKHDLSKYVGVREKKLNTQKLQSHLGSSTFLKVSLKDGIKEATEYYRKAISYEN